MEAGKRTVISIFEHNAVHDPDRVWLLRPKDDNDLTAGFESITYGAGIQAVNHAAIWLRNALQTPEGDFGTFAYQGPSDLRVILLCLAAAKLRKRILLPSRRASPIAQRHLVRTAGCTAIVHAKDTGPMFDPVELGVDAIIAPELADWLPGPAAGAPVTGETLPVYTKSWVEAQNDPWICLHTSGTTGLPKIVVYTQKMMTKFDAVPPVEEGSTPMSLYGRGAWFTTVPFSHFLGLVIALQFAPILGSVCVAPPALTTSPIFSARQMIDLINQTEPQGMCLPPADIERLVASEEGWAALKKVNCVNFVGAQLRKSVGEKLIKNGNVVVYGLGTTEAGGYPQLIRSDKEWDWITFPQWAGMTFERYPGNDEVFELVFYKQPELARFQQVFLAFPQLDMFRTKDLYYKHPSLKNTWQIAGRSDDFFKPQSGYGIFAKPVEDALLERAQHLVSAVLMAGEGRERPCLLMAPRTEPRNSLVDTLWPMVEEVNRALDESGRVKKELILIGEPDRPFKRNGKGEISRRDTLLEYEKEVEALYQRYDGHA